MRDLLATRLSRRRPAHGPDVPSHPPPVELLLAIDRAYRSRAAAGELKKIAPRRFNSTGEAWLPMMHERRDGYVFTALFSNTELAHRLRRTGEWVVVYFHEPGCDERRATIVTENVGPGRRSRGARSDHSRGIMTPCSKPPRSGSQSQRKTTSARS